MHIKIKNKSRARKGTVTNLIPLALAACGGQTEQAIENGKVASFPKDFQPPSPNYEAPNEPDPNFEVLKSDYEEPYWIAALEMDRVDLAVTPMLVKYSRELYFQFPDKTPSYDLMEIRDWEPANEKMMIAARSIFEHLNEVLDVEFVEDSEASGFNVISIGRSYQPGTSGFSYFPNPDYQIGMDVFISTNYDDPLYISGSLTNYDYEILLHEIGHALGLKHPFSSQGGNTSTLSAYEDHTRFTAMSYDDSPSTFTGEMRSLDWMALTKLYGVNQNYNADDDVYSFSAESSTFIIDGGGLDTINAEYSTLDVFIDLRPGAHSHIGGKQKYITSSSQLTISHGSDIEIVKTGSGNDTVIGNIFDNHILTGQGDDIIFSGGGSDIINSGLGADKVDLSEQIQAKDTVELSVPISGINFETIYGFIQGALGDVLSFEGIFNEIVDLFPLVSADNVPNAYIGNGILRVFGEGLDTADGIDLAFSHEGSLKNLQLATGQKSIIIAANSQATGESQHVFYAHNQNSEFSVVKLALLTGNALDIDQWHSQNFDFV